MTTIRAAVIPAKSLKDGKQKVRIAVAHNGKTRYVTTDITIDSEREFSEGRIVKRPDAAYLNTRLRKTLQMYQECIDEIQSANGLSCQELVELIKARSRAKSITFKELCDEYIEYANIKPDTARTYRIAYATLSKCIKPGMLVSNIAPSTILSTDKKLRAMKLRPATIRNYMTTLRVFIRYAVNNGYVSYTIDPFANYTIPHKVIRDAWLSVDEVRSIRDCRPPLKSTEVLRDYFMLSYYLGGMNLIDMLRINFKSAKGKMKYVRSKVERRANTNVEFTIPEEANAIIDRYLGPDGRLMDKVDGKYSINHDFCIHHISRLAEAAGISSRLIFYSARKSFAQHAFDIGIETSVIDYVLGHSLGSSKGMLFHYVSVTPAMASKAIRKVLDNLK